MNRRDFSAVMQANEETYGRLVAMGGSDEGARSLAARVLASRELRPAQVDCRTVYYIRSASGLIKIGIADDVGKRLATLQTGNAELLTIVATEPGGRARELELHDRFHFARIRGEWFRPDPRLLQHIDSIERDMREHFRRSPIQLRLVRA